MEKRKTLRIGRGINPISQCGSIREEKPLKMTKRELIRKLAQRLDINPKEAKLVVDTILEEIEEALTRGEKVQIRGFGVFSIREHQGFKGKNPRTGEVFFVPPRKVPHFKTAKELKERLNQPLN
jgi:integration host factor subunit beta